MNPSTLGFISNIPSNSNASPDFLRICTEINTDDLVIDVYCLPYTYGRYFGAKVTKGSG